MPTYVYPPTLQTDGQTTCDRKTPLCTIVRRAVKTLSLSVDVFMWKENVEKFYGIFFGFWAQKPHTLPNFTLIGQTNPL